MSVTANPPAYPATKRITAEFQPIQNRNSIYADFANDWAHHVEFTVLSKQSAGRAFSGSASAVDYRANDDFYRTNRYDIYSHWNRAFDHTQQEPLITISAVKSLPARYLIALLDQHISDTDALVVKALASKGAFNNLNSQQLAFLRDEQKAEFGLIPASDMSPDAIVARTLLKKHLITNDMKSPIYSGNNYGATSAQLIAVGKAFDPVADVVANGVKIINIYANVYASIQAGVHPSHYKGDIRTPVKANYDAFGARVAADPFFQSQMADNVKTLAKAGFKPSGNSAQDVWNAHLVEVALLVDAETNLDLAYKNGSATPQAPGALGAKLQSAVQEVFMHSPQLAGLLSLTLGVPPNSAVPYPK